MRVGLDPFDDSPTGLGARIASLYALLFLINLAAWGAAIVAFSQSSVLLGTALLAYLLGVRHGFDADHIAAIDNVVRNLMQDGKRPLSTGFFFALGHSTIVVFATLAITAAMPADLEPVHSVSGRIGTLVSAVFLLTIGCANLLVLRGLWQTVSRARAGETIDADGLDKLLSGRGLFVRLLRPLLRAVSRSWHLYPIGFLFGLGLDTATEIGLLGISVARATSFWEIMVFPALFTAGMTLVDTTDSVFMTGAYGWAFPSPVRKLWYNLTITATSVVVAFLIGGLEALDLVIGSGS